jgi:hypothetical protein
MSITWINANLSPVPQIGDTWLVAYWNDLITGFATCSSSCGGEFISRNQDFQIDWEIADGEDEINCCAVCQKVYE